MIDDYLDFVRAIYKKTGIDLEQYKEKQMKRRITSLLIKRECKSFKEYYTLINDNLELYQEFIDRITINVSEFYRNYKRWEILEEKILPKLLESNNRLKIWSAACSTGEEPYTIAISLSKFVPLNRISILATDLDEKALKAARHGKYNEKALKEVPKSIKEKHFVYENGFYYVDDGLKKSITFKKHNLLHDPYDQNFDLIVCRNVLIYFTEQAKDNIYKRFSRSLRDSGVLFVGSTEQIFNPAEYNLKPIETFFYQKTHN